MPNDMQLPSDGKTAQDQGAKGYNALHEKLNILSSTGKRATAPVQDVMKKIGTKDSVFSNVRDFYSYVHNESYLGKKSTHCRCCNPCQCQASWCGLAPAEAAGSKGSDFGWAGQCQCCYLGCALACLGQKNFCHCCVDPNEMTGDNEREFGCCGTGDNKCFPLVCGSGEDMCGYYGCGCVKDDGSVIGHGIN